MRVAVQEAIAVTNTLKSIGIPFKGRVRILGDNKGVIDNSTISGSMLKKKHISIAYHKVRESIASGLCDIFHVSGKENPADILTKPLGSDIYRNHLRKFMYGQGLPNGV